MARRDGYEPGLFCWVDLMAADHELALAFYGAVLGWEADQHAEGYWRMRHDGAIAAGVGGVPLHARERELGSQWSSYVRVDDADTTAARAAELGGEVIRAAFPIDGVGAMAQVADPQGAWLSLWQPGPFPGAEVVNEPGAFTWNDLTCTAPVGEAAAFYRDLFGWRVEEVPGAGGQYSTIFNGERSNGGMLPAPDGVPPAWTPYFGVADLEASAAKVAEAGGQVLVPPTAVGEAGRFATCSDDQGAVFALFQGAYDD